MNLVRKKPVEGIDFGWTLWDRVAFPDQAVISPSGIAQMMQSPKHYDWSYNKGHKRSSKAMEDGKMIHMAILEPQKFSETYFYLDKSLYPLALDGGAAYKERIKKLNEEQGLKLKVTGTNSELIASLKENDPEIQIWDEIVQKETSGKISITQNENIMLQGIRDSVASHEEINHLISHAKGRREQAFWYRHPRTGIIIHGVLDWLCDDFGGYPVFMDIKTCRSAEHDEFSKAIWNLKSFVQMAIYSDAMEYIFGIAPLGMYIAIEKTGPYIVEGYPADFGMLEQGRAVYEKKIDLFLECRETGLWPSYNNGKLKSISLPFWADKKLEEYAEPELEHTDA